MYLFGFELFCLFFFTANFNNVSVKVILTFTLFFDGSETIVLAILCTEITEQGPKNQNVSYTFRNL